MNTKSKETLIHEISNLLESHQIKFGYLLAHTNLYQSCSATHQKTATMSTLENVIEQFDYYLEQSHTVRSLLPRHTSVVEYFSRFKATLRNTIQTLGGVSTACKILGFKTTKITDLLKKGSSINNIEWFCKNGSEGRVYMEFNGSQYNLTHSMGLYRAKRDLITWIAEQVDCKRVYLVTGLIFLNGYYSTLSGYANDSVKLVNRNTVDKLLSIVYWLGGKANLSYDPLGEA